MMDDLEKLWRLWLRLEELGGANEGFESDEAEAACGECDQLWRRLSEGDRQSFRLMILEYRSYRG